MDVIQDVLNDLCNQLFRVQQHLGLVAVGQSVRAGLRAVRRGQTSPQEWVTIVGNQVDLIEVEPAKGRAVEDVREGVAILEESGYFATDDAHHDLQLLVDYDLALHLHI